ncbi:MAG: transcription antitermination protein NusB [Alphaproteobacteria bacterium ADurb.Bin438]|nr:MAG: transcription antitermination protein NusB [Alphaproteobacteria bacterium ADurb.Bin438]
MSGYKNRTNARLSVVQAIYSTYFNEGASFSEVVDDFLSGRIGGELLEEKGENNEIETFIPMGKTDSSLFVSIFNAWEERKEIVDNVIKENFNDKWSVERTEKLVFSILRAAVTEMMVSDVDKPVIIDEYMKIAISFYENGQEPRMINALLDKIAKGIK